MMEKENVIIIIANGKAKVNVNVNQPSQITIANSEDKNKKAKKTFLKNTFKVLVKLFSSNLFINIIPLIVVLVERL